MSMAMQMATFAINYKVLVCGIISIFLLFCSFQYKWFTALLVVSNRVTPSWSLSVRTGHYYGVLLYQV